MRIFPICVAFTLMLSVTAHAQTRGASRVVGKEGVLSGFYDKTWAVIIGIDDYPGLSYNQQLQQAVRDARGVEKALKDNYRFDRIITLYNQKATRDGIQRVLQGDLSQTGKNDGVFVFFSGHGNTVATEDGDLGYLLPYDGSFKETENYKNISMTTLKNDVAKGVPAKHIFFVMDACYSGLLLAQKGPGDDRLDADRIEYLKEITSERVRQVLSAGGKGQTVLDGGRNGHSVFAGRFLQALETADGYITAKEIGSQVPEKVFYDAQDRGHRQQPQFGRLAGQGDFVFVRRSLGSTVGQIQAYDKKIEDLKAQLKEEENKAAARAELERKKKEAEDLQRKVDEARRSGTPRWQDAPEEPAPTFAGDEHGEMVQIPAGNFQMGSNSGGNDEKPVHEVFLDEYYLDKYEVTVSQFRDFKTDYEPSDRSSCDGCPATNVSWYDAKSYCESVGKRLPTEAEWEKACGGPEGYSWSWGNRAESSKGRFGLSWDDGAVRVGSYGANGYGLHDMSGNAWEWCQDGYENDYYSKSPRNNPINETGSSGRVLRGGSWVSGANNARCENRNNLKPDLRHDSDGFRCAR